MLHELLIALNGFPGGIFVKDKYGKIQVAAGLPFLDPTEVPLLNRLCELGTHYLRFTEFISVNGHIPGKVNTSGLHGLYLKALCEALDQILDPYRQRLLELERQILSDRHLTAAHLQSSLEDYHTLFAALSIVLEQIVDQQAHGCYILEILHKATVNGIPHVKKAINRLLYLCHSVMFKQLSSWMLHGLLLDRHGEFFIREAESRGREGGVGSGQQPEETEELGLGGITGRQMKQLLISDRRPEASACEQFTIRADKLPCYIPARVAEKILFVGESVQMFDADTPGNKGRNKGSILRGQEDKFAKDLHTLYKQEVFELRTFEAEIDKIRSFVAEQLWRLIVEESNLLSNLRIMKDFYLLGRGELFLAFIDQAQSLLRPVPTATTEHDMNMAFQHAARNVLFEDETVLQRFHLCVDLVDGKKDAKLKKSTKKLYQSESASGDSQNASALDSGWRLLKLDYSVQWPLHILITNGVLERYNRVFRFLLYVKRIQLELQQCWALQMQRKHEIAQDSGSNKWWLRNHLAFLIDNLQYYLQVDVIESQFSVLAEKVQTEKDFEAIRLAHDNFLTSLLSQSFLLMKPIAQCLNDILELCHKFCGLMSQSENVLTEREQAQLDDITKKFRLQSNLLFKILSSVRSHQASPHLAQLLLRIDYNKYFTLAGGQLGSHQTLS